MGAVFDALYSNRDSPQAPQPVRVVPQGTPTVHEVDGSIGTGPLHLIRVNLRPILGDTNLAPSQVHARNHKVTAGDKVDSALLPYATKRRQ